MKKDRRDVILNNKQCFHVKNVNGKMFHVHTNEGLAALLESGFVDQEAVITIARCTNNS